ncbi:UDP-N-acetylmuramoyl-L-alanyl-D-glutamate--2,6-diaminopimelate ligase [Oceanobacter kriegii]|uniref:UDP-N-acetylmuramoyl-L-alanyl-D-glutamate--2, 6-diaminopimelate ligase n=1 Tax=Oceanobacter kriegii TaxID=64972 RepID=UPI00041B64B2|nr:UDP-N-acetylmuramoyl-L-alanyl-D-glutamate--2,6-diaminopimelate ligase [Oceanobacter kriegii]
MKLSQLIQNDFFVPPEWDREFGDIATDSRDVQLGDLFIARAGSAAHGAEYIQSAIERGAAVVLQAPANDEPGQPLFRCEFNAQGTAVPVFRVDDLAARLPHWLHRCYDGVANMAVFGVTGTNGKSSCVSYLAQLSTALNKPCGMLGTLGNGLWPRLQPTRNTTPDLSVVLRTLDNIGRAGADRSAMEVSSHGLDQGRVFGLRFSGVMMTNLTQDHLDYHGTMEAYFEAKKTLLTNYDANIAVVNTDCEYGRQLFADSELPALPMGYGSRAAMEANGLLPDFRDRLVSYEITEFTGSGIRANIESPWGNAELVLPLLGEFNLANALGAMTLLACSGESFSELVVAAASLQAVAGRMEVFVPAGSAYGPVAVVDYAHTPDAIETVLTSLQPWQRPINLVFGCGGDRDRSKRPLMMTAAMNHANRIWLTDDNPRSESPAAIFADVMTAAGADAFGIEQQHDRKEAIADALTVSAAEAIVVIAGKGHEDYQEINGERRPYSDIDVLKSLGYVPVGGQHAV